MSVMDFSLQNTSIFVIIRTQRTKNGTLPRHPQALIQGQHDEFGFVFGEVGIGRDAL